ncbi:DUF3524 domain-containing protein [Stieleria sp. JC731]|uniref:tRNA-queuosine alpha-mannosyltransferase domain-containing protein n=1 Tax=Pirellulaceae TaxID=2691357 RepID=UPI001E5A0FA2|nr:DUF3524 domain-containing protein [Stieleria sp. JC731]MCC9602388.1 DUF3524 domain-containing protein [Stieleria sp. JC731]
MCLNVLAIEPYYGGSHRVFIDSVAGNSIHQWTLATLPARHWKWRMRSAPMVLAKQLRDKLSDQSPPNVIFCSDMLDLPVFLGSVARLQYFHEWISAVPIVTYYHENQWAYPTAPRSQPDYHYGFTNLLTAALSTECWFNSRYNRETFLQHSRRFLRRMPDDRDAIDLDYIEQRCRVFYPGFTTFETNRTDEQRPRGLRLGWVGRFEADKRPDRFFDLLVELQKRSFEFELILLGERGREVESHDQIASRFKDQILFDGYADSQDDYHAKLQEIDVVVSTADHEFFGIAMCEAIWAGAVPVVPNGLAYPEYVPDPLRFQTINEAANLIESLHAPEKRTTYSATCQTRIQHLTNPQTTAEIDERLRQLVG